MSRFYRCRIEGQDPGVVEAKDAAEAKVIAQRESGGVVVTVSPIPYPGGRVLHNPSQCPPFCYQPGRCEGHTACPAGRSCCE